MAYTERHKQWMARYRVIRAELKAAHPESSKGWLSYYARVRTDMEFANA